MSAKKTTQQFIAEATLKHNGSYDYSKVEYKNAYTKVIITCPIHGDFEQTPTNHLYGYGCSKCGVEKTTKTTQQFIEQVSLKHNGFYDYSKVDYKNDKTKVVITCPIHGDFEQAPHHHLKGHGCPKCSGTLLKTTQQFIEQASLKHDNFYNYSKVDYKNAHTKIIITCPIHGDFKQKPNSHLEGQGCSKCGIEKIIEKTTKTTQQFVEEATLKHNGFYSYSKVDYKGNGTKVVITCPIHGDFEQTPSNHLQGRGCPKCSRNLKKTTQQFIGEASLKHNGFYDYSKVDYKGDGTKVIITCPTHGDFEQTPSSHLQGKGCSKCYGKLLTKTTQQFVEEATLKHNGFYDYSKVEYSHSHTKVIITCPIHGDFKQTPTNHLNGQDCPKCSKSISKASQEYLDHLGIPNIMGETRERVFNLGGIIIKVDGYDPETNTIIEYLGDFWHGNPNKFNLNEINKVNKKTFGQLLKETQRRSRLIKSHGFNLVTIWESDWKKISKETP